MQFFMENLKMNRKRTIFFYLLERGFELQIFSYFLAHDLNFHGREGDEIKSKQASKIERTLLTPPPGSDGPNQPRTTHRAELENTFLPLRLY